MDIRSPVVLLANRVKSTPLGQKVIANNEDIFLMLNVLAKTNATALASLKRAEHHEKLTRTMGAKLNEVVSRVNAVKWI